MVGVPNTEFQCVAAQAVPRVPNSYPGNNGPSVYRTFNTRPTPRPTPGPIPRPVRTPPPTIEPNNFVKNPWWNYVKILEVLDSLKNIVGDVVIIINPCVINPNMPGCTSIGSPLQ